MAHGTGPIRSLRTYRNSSSEIANFLHAFGSRALVTSAAERKHAVESLLHRLEGVRHARVETTRAGEIGRIHLVTDGRGSTAQLARHVRSALLAAYDLDVDPRLISFVPMRADEDEPPLPRGGAEARACLRQIGFQQEGYRVIAHVELDWLGQTFHGLNQDADTPQGRMMAAARAVLKALEKVTDRRVAFLLEALHTLQALKRTVIVASVRLISESRRSELVGSAMVAEDPNYAAAQAVLAAVNRSFALLGSPEMLADEPALLAESEPGRPQDADSDPDVWEETPEM